MRRLNLAVVVLTLFTLTSPSFAQQAATVVVPSLIRYGGTVKDALGAPLASSTVGVTFAIYARQEGGAAVWMETQSVTTDASGNYSVLLGSTTATGLPNDLFSQQEQRWLGVQVQGQPEQPRVLMVSVPYAFKAHDAETLGGKSASDFVLANGATSAANSGSASGGVAVSLTANGANTQSAGSQVQAGQADDGPTNFSGSTTDQIVAVTQNGTGAGVIAAAPTLGLQGIANAPSGTAYGVQGVAYGTAGVGLIGTATSATGFTYGLRGTSSSTSGTGVRGIDNATSGSTIGISGYVSSSAGTAGVFNNAAGGNILVGQNNGATKFTVDGNGDVTIAGNFSGSGTLTTAAGVAATLTTTGNAVSGDATATSGAAIGVSGQTNSGGGAGVQGINLATSGLAYGVVGSTISTSTGATGVLGEASGLTGATNGVSGITFSNGANAAGVNGQATSIVGGASGVFGQTNSPNGYGVWGIANASTSTTTAGVLGQASSSPGVLGSSAGAAGVSGQSSTGPGVLGTGAYGVIGNANTSENAVGVYGQSSASGGVGVFGSSSSAAGVYGQSSSGPGLSGTGFYGVYGVGNTTSGNVGVYGQSGTGNGVYGTSSSIAGVKGQSASGNGVDGVSSSAAGVHGLSSTGPGVYGTTSSATSAGVYAINTSSSGSQASGLYAQTDSPYGAAGYFVNNNTGTGSYLLYGESGGNQVFYIDVLGNTYFSSVVSASVLNANQLDSFGPLNVAGEAQLSGNLQVVGDLQVNGQKNFQIDDPLDPANRYLSHSAIESSEMMNLYTGNVTTDEHGDATVQVPAWFEALNGDFRYQLTVIGQFAQAIVADEIHKGRFRIRTDKPAVKVSWQVTGVRQDAYAKAHPLVVEQDKPVAERGYYLHPELFGQPESKGISHLHKLAAEEKKQAEGLHPGPYGAAADKNTDAMLRH